jgi:hypothetical protein
MKKFDDSRKAALQCLAALPRYAPALNNLALLQVTVGQLTDADGNLRASMDADQALTCAQSNAASLQVLFRTFVIVWFAQFCVFWGIVFLPPCTQKSFPRLLDVHFASAETASTRATAHSKSWRGSKFQLLNQS